MNPDRVFLVGIAWTLLLIGLLILREFLLALHRSEWRPALRTVNSMVLVMFGAAALTAMIQLATVISPSAARAPTPSGGVAARPTPTPAGPTSGATMPTMPPIPTPEPATSSPAQPTPIETPGPTPAPTVPGTPMPSATPVPSPSPTPTPATSGGTVTAGPTFRVYDVVDGQVSGFRDVQAAQRFSAEVEPPQTVAFPSLGDPEGVVRLVVIRTGPFAGVLVSPDDRGVEWVPAP